MTTEPMIAIETPTLTETTSADAIAAAPVQADGGVASEAAVVPAAVASTDNADGVRAAQELDARIDQGLKRLTTDLARTYVEIGRDLAAIHKSKGYKHLGYSWENYLKSKRAYGKTLMYQLLQLGRAEGIETVLDRGMGGSQLLEFAKQSPAPAKIAPLVAATWEKVKEQPIRQLAQALRKHVEAHPGEFPKGKPFVELKKPRSVKQRLSQQIARLASDEEKTEFLDQVREFLEEFGPAMSPR